MGNVDAHKIKIDKLTHIIKSKPTTPKPQNEVTHTALTILTTIAYSGYAYINHLL
jgi:hypothetical protein